MDRRRERDQLGHLLRLQKLQGAREEQRLITRVAQVSRAQQDAEVQEARLQGTVRELDDLLNGSAFCPEAFALAGACVLLDERCVADAHKKIADAHAQEAEQRIIWHQAGRKEEWLTAKTNRLARKIVQLQDDKSMLEVAATQWLNAERDAAWI